MIIRRNGETTILRPKQDQVLVNGFTPVIRPSSILPSYQSMMPDSQIASSLSIMNKMSIKKPEQTSIIKAKRRNRHRKQYYHDKFNDQNHIKNHHVNYILIKSDMIKKQFSLYSFQMNSNRIPQQIQRLFI